MKDPTKQEVYVTPFRCSRGHIIVTSRPPKQARASNCDRFECVDNNDRPVQIGRRQRLNITVWGRSGKDGRTKVIR